MVQPFLRSFHCCWMHKRRPHVCYLLAICTPTCWFFSWQNICLVHLLGVGVHDCLLPPSPNHVSIWRGSGLEFRSYDVHLRYCAGRFVIYLRLIGLQARSALSACLAQWWDVLGCFQFLLAQLVRHASTRDHMIKSDCWTIREWTEVERRYIQGRGIDWEDWVLTSPCLNWEHSTFEN